MAWEFRYRNAHAGWVRTLTNPCVSIKFSGQFADHIFVGRSWQDRRVVWTHEELQFSRVGDLQLIDKIPMHEILCATKMSRMSFSVHDNELLQQRSRKEDLKTDASKECGTGKNHRTSSLVSSKRGNTHPLDNTIQIKTIADGHNSGRSYYICLQSEDAYIQMMAEVTRLAKAARKKAQARSRFEKAQMKVRKVYNSNVFQKATAGLIVAVSLMKLSSTARRYLSDFVNRTLL